jgi:PPK2 family polyphosphate:nucleotide phosphotransferase
VSRPTGEPIDALRVGAGDAPRLADRDPASTCGLPDKDRAREMLDADIDELRDLQRRLWAEARRSVLLVLQGMDASGKDGTIRKVFTGVNPQGVRVVSFKAPSTLERAHDFLWRVHQVMPQRGEIGIFNRSHYEDVVAAQVIGVIDDKVRTRRYEHIAAFERMLHDEGTTMVKVFLHISKDEQRERLEARLQDPNKRWKFNVDDIDTRKHWDEYQHLYEEALAATSTKHAPWYVVPANRKWVRDVVVARLLVAVLRDLDPQYPAPSEDLDDLHFS